MIYTCECDYCGVSVLYTAADYEYVPGDLTEIYIKCPVCGRPIIIEVKE